MLSFRLAAVAQFVLIFCLCLAPGSAQATTDAVYPEFCKQNNPTPGTAKECEIAPTSLHPWICGASIGFSSEGSTPVECRDTAIQKYNDWYADPANNYTIRLRMQPHSAGTCAEPSTDSNYWTGKPYEILYFSSCLVETYYANGPQAGQLYSGPTNMTMDQLATCEPDRRAIGSGPPVNGTFTHRPHICYSDIAYKNLGDTCPKCGNPINPATGNKYQRETDFAGAGVMPLQIVRYYNSKWSPAGVEIGKGWRLTYDRRVMWDGRQSALVSRPDGKALNFYLAGGVWTTEPDIRDVLLELKDAGGTTTGWSYLVAATQETELYSASGKLQSITDKAGLITSLAYSNGSTPVSVAPGPGYLIQVVDPFGRSLSFAYGSNGRVASIADPAGEVYQYQYDTSGRLERVIYPGLTNKQYFYSEPAHNAAPQMTWQLTGIQDELGTRIGTYKYDSTGKAYQTEGAGGVNRHTISGNTATDPLGTTRSYIWNWVQGVATPYRLQQPCAASGCSGTNDSYTNYNSDGSVASTIDFNGKVTSFTYDTSRVLETSRNEAAGQRIVSTEWHATWRLPKRTAGPLAITTFAFHGDPGTSCAPVGASTALVCSKTVQATTDNTGAAGFAAVTTGTPRVWNYTYNAAGQILEINGPRSDVTDTTTYTYDGQGNVASVTNAANQITTMPLYDAVGRLKKIVAPNGLETLLDYWPRGWLKERKVGTAAAGYETTAYTYDAVGLLDVVTLPDGSTLNYDYDGAHRLIRITDGQGNKIDYELDAMGNRKAEYSRDPQGALARQLTREYNALNRLFKDIGGTNPASQVTEYSYDGTGNLKTTKDALNRLTTNFYDPLNRLTRVEDPVNGAASPTLYEYNGQNQLTKVTDPKGLITTYTYNGFGEMLTQVSPDTGTTSFTYDAAGNLLTKTDARTVTATYTYDALNRVATVSYPAVGTDPAETVTYTYDSCTNGVGRLCSVADKTGTTSYTYDLWGRVTAKGQTLGALTQTVSYGYNSAGQLTSITYPSGRVIGYTYANNRPVSVTINGKTVLNQAVYEPFGPLGGWMWGNATPQAANAHLRIFDKDYRATQVVSDQVGAGAHERHLTWNAVSTITAITDPANPGNSYTYGYDGLDRLTGVTPAGGSQLYGYTYDKIGNRLTSTVSGATTTYTMPATSHRLSSLSGAQSKTYTYDAVGNMTGDGTTTWRYGGNNRHFEVVTPGGTVGFAINALGQRVKKTATAGATRFMYDEAGRLIGEYTDTGTRLKEHVWLNDLPVAVIP